MFQWLARFIFLLAWVSPSFTQRLDLHRHRKPSNFTVDTKLMLSQGGQDALLWDKMFNHDVQFETGTFVEFGARNGKSESNTFFFENQLLWHGLLLEAIPKEQKDIGTNRPRSAVLDGAVCESNKKVDFSIAGIGGWSGRAEVYDESRKNNLVETISVACFTLTTLLELFGIRHVSYLSVDTEGSELQALKGFPWGNVTVDVVGVEVLTGRPERKAKESDLLSYMASVGMEIWIDHQFAEDTKDTFFVPAAKTLRNLNNYNKFLGAKNNCKILQRCL